MVDIRHGDAVVTRLAKRLAAFLVGVAMTVPLNSAVASPLAVARTTVVMFPWQPNGQLAPQVHVGLPLSGYCWVGAFPGPEDEYAWRCLVGNSILTPCYSPLSQRAREVVCAVTPWWAYRVPLIHLQRPLPMGQADKGGYWERVGDPAHQQGTLHPGQSGLAADLGRASAVHVRERLLGGLPQHGLGAVDGRLLVELVRVWWPTLPGSRRDCVSRI